MHRILSAGLVMGLLSSTALSADLAHNPKSEPVAPSVFTWSGVYGGLFAGFGALDSATQFLCAGPDGRAGVAGCPVLPSRRGTDDGFIAGGEVGGSWEVGSGFVVGAAADYQFTRLWDYGEREGRFTDSGSRALIFRVTHAGQRLDQLATLRGKVGFALGPTLIYGTGGLAFGNVRIDSNLTAFNRSVFDAREGEVRTGYAVGAGLEHAFTDHLSAKVEGLYRAMPSAPASSTRSPITSRPRSRACTTTSAAARSSRHRSVACCSATVPVPASRRTVS